MSQSYQKTTRINKNNPRLNSIPIQRVFVLVTFRLFSGNFVLYSMLSTCPSHGYTNPTDTCHDHDWMNKGVDPTRAGSVWQVFQSQLTLFTGLVWHNKPRPDDRHFCVFGICISVMRTTMSIECRTACPIWIFPFLQHANKTGILIGMIFREVNRSVHELPQSKLTEINLIDIFSQPTGRPECEWHLVWHCHPTQIILLTIPVSYCVHIANVHRTVFTVHMLVLSPYEKCWLYSIHPQQKRIHVFAPTIASECDRIGMYAECQLALSMRTIQIESCKQCRWLWSKTNGN